jgi:UDP-GlcNAc:undecaprenyl-phosphate/decaprenyl-phosphate GlcNAc-1-phosphate transferase
VFFFTILQLIVFAASSVLAAALLPFAIKWALKTRFLDRPDQGRKDHARSTPPIGGLVLIPLFLLFAPFLGLSLLPHMALYLAVVLLALVGVIDDRIGMRASVKFFCQLLAAILVVSFGGAMVPHLGHLFGSEMLWGLKGFNWIFSVAAVVFLINAMNMIDGVDGLLGGITLAMLVWLVAGAGAAPEFALPLLLLSGLLLGFLVHNARYPGHPRATLFMGDTGSMVLGLLIAYFAIHLAALPQAQLAPIGVAFIVVVPIIDTFALFFARVTNHRGPFTPGRDHIHHRLLERQFSPAQVALILSILTLASGAIGFYGPRWLVIEAVMSYTWIALLAGYTLYLLRRAPRIYAASAV